MLQTIAQRAAYCYCQVMPLVNALTALERETIVLMNDADNTVTITTHQRTMLTKLRRLEDFTEVASGWHGKTEWAEFTCPVERFSIGAKRRVSPSTRETLRERAISRRFGRTV